MGYDVLDISGDAGIRASGETCGEAFAEAAVGMYSLVTDHASISVTKTIEVSAGAGSVESLLVRFLNELIFRFDAYGFIGKKVTVTSFSDKAISARIEGEEFDPERHEQRLLLKAATYHNIKISRTEKGCDVEIIFDI